MLKFFWRIIIVLTFTMPTLAEGQEAGDVTEETLSDTGTTGGALPSSGNFSNLYMDPSQFEPVISEPVYGRNLKECVEFVNAEYAKCKAEEQKYSAGKLGIVARAKGTYNKMSDHENMGNMSLATNISAEAAKGVGLKCLQAKENIAVQCKALGQKQEQLVAKAQRMVEHAYHANSPDVPKYKKDYETAVSGSEMIRQIHREGQERLVPAIHEMALESGGLLDASSKYKDVAAATEPISYDQTPEPESFWDKHGGKVLVGGALVGGAMLLKGSKKDKNKDPNEEARKKFEKENLVVTDENGNKIVCKKVENAGRKECTEILQDFCENESPTAAGCMAMVNAVCTDESTNNPNKNYCMYARSRAYCAQDGSVVNQSPACKWLGDRPEDCSGAYNDVRCLSKDDDSVLANNCVYFPSDPLCKARSNGMVVVSPNPVKDDGPSSVPVSQGEILPTPGSLKSGNITTMSANALIQSNSKVIRDMCREGNLSDCSADRLPANY